MIRRSVLVASAAGMMALGLAVSSLKALGAARQNRGLAELDQYFTTPDRLLISSAMKRPNPAALEDFNL